MIEVLKQAYQLLLTEPHAPTVCNQLEVIFRRAIAELESQEPVAWMFQHNETGRMNYVSNDGIHNPNMFLEMNPRYTKIGPLYTHPPQRTWVGLTGEMLLKAAQSSLSPEQYDHFEAMSKYQPDIYDRLAYAIRVQDE